MSDVNESTSEVKSEAKSEILEKTFLLNIPGSKNSELSVTSTPPLKKGSSIKFICKAGGIFNNQVKSVRSVSSLNQTVVKPVVQNNKKRPKTISTITSSTRQNSDNKLPKNSISKCNSVMSLCSTTAGSGISHKPGAIPSYLKSDSKSSVESAFFAKLRKFKVEKKKLNEQQNHFKKEYNDLKRLKEKLITMGGKELKLDEINFIELNEDVGSEAKLPLKCEGTAIELAKKDIDLSLMNDIEAQISQIREADTTLRNKFMKASADILENLNHIQDEDVKQNCLLSFKYFEDHNDRFKNVENATKELLSQNLLRLKKDFIDAATESSVSKILNEQRSKILEYQIDNNQLKKQVDDLSKKLKLSEQQVKTQEAIKRDLETNKENSIKQIEEHLSEIEKLKNKCKTAKLVEEKYKKDLENLRSDVNSYEAEITKLKAEVNRFRNQLSVSDQNCVDLSEKMRLKENKCIKLESQLELASNETMNENERLSKQIEELQSNLSQRDVKVANLQHFFNLQATETTTREFNDAIEGIRKLRGNTCDSYRLDILKDELNYRALDLTDQKDTFTSLQKLLVIRDNLLASMRHEQGDQ